MHQLLPDPKHFFAAVKIALLAIFVSFLLPVKLLAQAPTISYDSPHAFGLNVSSSLTPIASNGAARSYGIPVVLGTGVSFSQNGLALEAFGNREGTDEDNS